MFRRPPRSTRTDTLFPSRRSSDLTRALAGRLVAGGAELRFGTEAEAAPAGDVTVDCRGLAARDRLAELRGVRGEMLVLRSREVTLTRPVRLLHPRIPVYLVPRGEGRTMVGATMIESASQIGRAHV